MNSQGKRRSILRICAWLLLAAALPLQAAPPGPESGFYVALNRPQSGFTIERQGNQIGLLIYSYAIDGTPQFYSGGGQLTAGGRVIEVPFFGLGSYEGSEVSGDLFRTSGAQPLPDVRPIAPPRPQSTRVGRFRLSFVPNDSPLLDLTFEPEVAGGTIPPGISLQLYRLNFGYGGFGTSVFNSERTCIADYRGQWVFVDQSNLARPAWRYNFTESSTNPPPNTCAGAERWSVVFRDPIRNAELRCAQSREPDPVTRIARRDGCELFENGQLQFAVHSSDLGLERMVGSLGPLADETEDFARRSQIVLGLRVK